MPKQKTKERNYTTVSLPNSLSARIDSVVESNKYGYQNKTDFVLDAVRKRLRELGFLE